MAEEDSSELSVTSVEEPQPRQVFFVEEVTELFQKYLPEFWKLGQAYLAGDLFVVDVRAAWHLTDVASAYKLI